MADELVFTLSIKDNASPQIDAFTRKIKGLGQEAQKEFGAFRENFNKSFGDLGKPIQSVNDFRTAVLGLSGAFAAIGVQKAGQFVADSVKNFAAYEQQLVSVQRTMGLTKTELDALGESLRTLALSDLKGQVVADDLAKIAEVAGSLGVAKDDLIDFTKNVAMVATATDQSMEKVATSFGKIANVFKGSLGDDAYKQIGAIGSAFDKLADDMAATVPGMLNFVNRMGGVASSMGLTVDQTAALAATLESVGLPAERGATAMNNVMLTLMKNSSSFADALSIDAEKLATALKEKPVEALQMVLAAMENLGQTKGQDELLRVMEDLMGKGNGVTEVVLKMQTAQTDFATALGKSKQAFDEATRAGESFNQSASTQAASWQAIKTAVDDLSKSVGQQLQPTLNTLGTWLQTAATWWAEAFRADNINAFFDSVVAGVNAMVDGFQQDLDGLKKAWEDVTTALSTGWEGFQQLIEKTDSWFAGIIREIIDTVLEIPKAFEEISKGITKSIDDSIKSIGRLGEAINKTVFQNEKAIGFFEKMTDKIYGVEDALEGHSLTPALQRYSVAAIEAGGSTQELSTELVQGEKAVMRMDEVFSKFSESLGGLSGGIGKIGGLFGIDTSGITDVISKIQGFSELPKVFADIKSSFEGFSELPKVLSDIEESLSGIGEAFKSLKGFDLKSIFSGGGGISGLISSLSGIGSVAGIIMAAWKPVEDFFKGLFKDTKSKGTEAAEAFQKFVRDNISGGAELAAGMDKAFHGMDFHDQFAQMTDYTYQLWNAFANTPIDGVNTGLQLLEETMKAAGVPTEKLGQVAIQTFVGMQNAGYDAAEMSAKFAEMLNLTTEQADLLVQTLTGIAPPEAALQSLVFSTDASKQAFEALTATLTTVQANSTITQAQFETLSGSLQQVMSDGQMTGVEIQNLATQMVNAGIPIDQVSTQLINVATSSGMTTAEVQTLQAALSSVTATQQSVADSSQSLNSSLANVSKGYATAAEAARAFAQAQAQAAINRSMQGLSTPPTYHTGGIVQRYHTGGLIDWTAAQKAHSGMMLKRDEVPIIAQTGEAVLNRGAVSMLGSAGVNALNRGAMGGTVINVNITGNSITKDTDLRALAREVSAEISRLYRARA